MEGAIKYGGGEEHTHCGGCGESKFEVTVYVVSFLHSGDPLYWGGQLTHHVELKQVDETETLGERLEAEAGADRRHA